MDSRDEWLARTFIELADTLVADFDLIEFLSMLADRCVELVGTAEVGLVLVGPHGLQVMASSTERMKVTELLEVQYKEGPCFDCYRMGFSVLNQHLASADSRWPRFAPIARESGFQMVHAVPLRLRNEVIGAMNVFDTSLHELTLTESNLLRAFADAATIGILQERTVKQQSDLSIQLQGALNSRIAVEQAKGIVSERLNVDMDTAFGMIRAHARNHGTLLSAVADALARGSLSAAELASPAKERSADRTKGRPD
ncbi:MAG TPA: GAF and ANTAR domain-containing protein [Acidimicrobiales bacterium]|nr:GAF and ANTAR domain-containing protein [Acidimicrobiales bacterium]